jgi:hypothetical protein
VPFSEYDVWGRGGGWVAAGDEQLGGPCQVCGCDGRLTNPQTPAQATKDVLYAMPNKLVSVCMAWDHSVIAT